MIKQQVSMKRTSLLFFMLFFLLSSTFAAKIDGIYFNFNGEEAEVTYAGDCENGIAYQGHVKIPSTVIYESKEYVVTAIGESAFANCTSLIAVTIPKTVNRIGSDVFSGCDNIETVHCYAIIPPTGYGIPTLKGTTLYVPNTCGNAYQADSYWGVFNIVALPKKIGDLNGDNIVNVSDASFIIDAILNGCPPDGSDLNNDGVIDVSDITMLIKLILCDVQPVTNIEISPSTLSLFVGAKEQISAAATPSNSTNKDIAWFSSDCNVATVNNEGIVTAIAVGNVTITCVAKDGSGVKATCAVTVKQPVTSITLSSSSLTLTKGATQKLSATVSPTTASNNSVIWSSSNTTVATVSADGLVTAVAAGSATITCTAKDGSGVKATCAVTVKQPVTGISLSSSSITLTEGATQKLTATVSPTTASNKSVTWSSSNTKVATVSADGLVTAVAAGSATITCTAKDGSGAKATCAVTVKLPKTTYPDLSIRSNYPSGSLTITAKKGQVLSLKWSVTFTKYNQEDEAATTYSFKAQLLNSSGTSTLKTLASKSSRRGEGASASGTSSYTFTADGTYKISATITRGSGNASLTNISVE